MKILLVDDDSDICQLMQETLKDFGSQEIVTCRCYQDVVDLDRKIKNFDVVILDVNLGIGKKNGVDTLNWMFENGYDQRAIFFTGHARSYPLLQSTLQKPNVHLLAKPASVDMIKQVVYGE